MGPDVGSMTSSVLVTGGTGTLGRMARRSWEAFLAESI